MGGDPTGLELLRGLIADRRNQLRLGKVVVGYALFGAFLDALSLSGLLKFVFGLGYLSLGVFLSDVAVALRYGRLQVPSYPAPDEIWGVSGRAILFGSLAGAIWGAPLLADPPVGEVIAFGSAVLTGLFVRYACGPDYGEGGLGWFAALLGVGGFAASVAMTLRWSVAWASVFAPLAVAAGLLVVILSAAAVGPFRD